MQQHIEKLYPLAEVAEFLTISPLTLAKWAREGRIPHKRVGRLFRFSESDVAAIVRAFAAK
jgi:excisionase family DNA binding protein